MYIIRYKVVREYESVCCSFTYYDMSHWINFLCYHVHQQTYVMQRECIWKQILYTDYTTHEMYTKNAIYVITFSIFFLRVFSNFFMLFAQPKVFYIFLCFLLHAVKIYISFNKKNHILQDLIFMGSCYKVLKRLTAHTHIIIHSVCKV